MRWVNIFPGDPAMKFLPFFVLVTSVFSSSAAFAISDSDLASTCLTTGKAKVVQQAEAFGCTVDASAVEVQGIDNRWYNPSKYVWYQVFTDCNGADRVISLVQFYDGRCF
jgi:hypothetical protein